MPRNAELIYIAGMGMTAFGRQPDMDVKGLTGLAVNAALADAGATIAHLGAVFFGNTGQGALEGQHAIRGQIALRPHGIEAIPIFNVENACASGASALYLASAHLRAGLADIVLAVGVEKMNVPDKTRVQSLFDGGWDISTIPENLERLKEIGGAFDPDPASRSLFMDVYAAMMRRHMDEFGATQRQLAVIASKNHGHGVRNPLAKDARAFSVDEVLAGRLIVDPLTRPMCAPISDGAAAAILCTADGLRRLANASPAKILACEMRSGTERAFTDYENHLVRRCATAAYEAAGLGPEDIDVVELHDATAFGEMLQTECLSLCAIGEGGVLADSGATTLGGRIPVNTSGGLESKGHPVGATGLAQVYELFEQVRGRAGDRQVLNARIGLAENGGGLLGVEEGVASIIIVGRV